MYVLIGGAGMMGLALAHSFVATNRRTIRVLTNPVNSPETDSSTCPSWNIGKAKHTSETVVKACTCTMNLDTSYRNALNRIGNLVIAPYPAEICR
jgi:hypothetical protein